MRKLPDSHNSFDRLIDGKAPPAEQSSDSLSLFFDQATRIASTAPSPTVEQAHMRAIMKATQLLADKGEPAARPASKATGPGLQASGLPKRRRKMVLSSLFSSLATKLAAAGVAVLMTGTGALAATGGLPDTLQDKVSVAADVIGIDIPSGDVEEDAGDVAGEEDTDSTDDETSGGKSSSDNVHAAIDATEPGPERGKAVSEAAKQKPAGETDGDETDADTSADAGNGSATSAAVHEAIAATEPGPERGKAVSAAASGKTPGETDGEDEDEDDEEETSETSAVNKNRQ